MHPWERNPNWWRGDEPEDSAFSRMCDASLRATGAATECVQATLDAMQAKEKYNDALYSVVRAAIMVHCDAATLSDIENAVSAWSRTADAERLHAARVDAGERQEVAMRTLTICTERQQQIAREMREADGDDE